MRGEIERSDEGEQSRVAESRRLGAVTVVGPVREVAHTVANGVAAVARGSLTRIRLDEDGRTIRPRLRSSGGV